MRTQNIKTMLEFLKTDSFLSEEITPAQFSQEMNGEMSNISKADNDAAGLNTVNRLTIVPKDSVCE